MHRKFMAGVLMIFAGIAIVLSAFIPVEGGTAADFWLPFISGVLWMLAGCIVSFNTNKTPVQADNSD